VTVFIFAQVICKVVSAASSEEQIQTIICPTKISKTYKGLFANCRGLNLTTVPDLEGNITALDLSENRINLTRSDFTSYNENMILEGSVTGLNNLTALRLEHNGNMSLSESFFDNFPSLKNLNMIGVRLPKQYFQNESIRLFRNLTKLENLDLSSSDLFHLPKHSFLHSRFLKNLLLSHNFQNIDEEALWHECTGKPAFYIVSSMFALLISAALFSFLVVKHKTQIVVFFHRLFRGVAGLPTREDFRYDGFTGYADRDFYLQDRDSELGGSRAISILDGVRNSWKMVLVMSQNFVTDEWSIYTMHAVALYAATGRIPKRLVILLDRANPCEVPDTLLCIADEDTILPIPRPNDDDSWEHLRRLLK
ncbi:uncharacterized protein LOC121366463, partial [Gigantopelta aegis]|uniref:uncharacterized protein LOC121366463 n=1 Tax=Gigantopelta aegis TaxID=1735272 RepID=UPI001B887845